MELTPLAGRARLLFHAQALMQLLFVWTPGTVFFGTAVGIASASFFYGATAGIAFWFLLFFVVLWYPSLAFDRWGWLHRGDDLLIARGVWIHRLTAIPTARIQHVDLKQGPLEQWLGLARLQVYTASGVGADGVIPGLELAEAEALRDRLVKVEGDDGV